MCIRDSRCTYEVYREYMANNYTGQPPTLKDLYQILSRIHISEGYSYARYAAHVPDCSLVQVGEVPVQCEYPVSYTHLDVYKRQAGIGVMN